MCSLNASCSTELTGIVPFSPPGLIFSKLLQITQYWDKMDPKIPCFICLILIYFSAFALSVYCSPCWTGGLFSIPTVHCLNNKKCEFNFVANKLVQWEFWNSFVKINRIFFTAKSAACGDYYPCGNYKKHSPVHIKVEKLYNLRLWSIFSNWEKF